MDLAPCLTLWFLLVQILSENKVSCCLDMILKEFSQMFAGPGGTLMGTSNANNLDRIRMFNNYQPPSIDQIEDEQGQEGKLDSEEDNNHDEYDDDILGVRRNSLDGRRTNGRRDRLSKLTGNEKDKARNKVKAEASGYKLSNKRDSTDRARSEPCAEKENDNFKDARLRLLSKIRKAKLAKTPKERTIQARGPLGLFQVEPLPDPAKSLYKLQPRTSLYQSYRPNVYEDSDEDSMTFQPRDDVRNRAKTGRVNQPIIRMMTNILDTIQLTSKHNFKRAKEKELRDKAREALQKLHRN